MIKISGEPIHAKALFLCERLLGQFSHAAETLWQLAFWKGAMRPALWCAAGTIATYLYMSAALPDATISGDCIERYLLISIDPKTADWSQNFLGIDRYGQMFISVVNSHTHEWEWWVQSPHHPHMVCRFGNGHTIKAGEYTDFHPTKPPTI